MADTNRFGLSRYIPSDVKRNVRSRCGFGCVVCGSALFDYEHFDPEFANATEHDSNGITLLCPNHHRAKGGVISRLTLEKSVLKPFCTRTGFSHLPMDVDDLIVVFGPITSEGCKVALEVRASFGIYAVGIGNQIHHWVPEYKFGRCHRAIWFEPPEENGGPLRLNAIVNNWNGSPLVNIRNNVWNGSIESKDICNNYRAGQEPFYRD